jgi:outer membrane protein OmpA-like peptidoglycan-associated protein
LTWRIGTPPVIALRDPVDELELDPPAAGQREPIVIYSPPMVVTLPKVIEAPAPAPQAVVQRELVPVYGTHVLFDTNRWDMTPLAQVSLKIAAQRALQIPGSRIGVATGHADVRGSKDRNRVLAQNRAESVIAFLVGFGYPRDQIELVNAGDAQPLMAGTTPAAHQANRRVDVVVMGLN